MSYQALSPDFNTMNDAQKNSAAIAAGYTGLNDYNDQINRGKSSPSGNGSGFNPGAMPASSGAPTLDLVGITNAAYNTPEITAASQAITDSQTKLTARQQALATAQTGINDNPFFSEATRVGKSQQLTQQANADFGVIQNEQKIAQGKVDSLKADAAIKVNAAKGQYDINEQTYKDNLSQFNTLLSSGALDNASGSDIAQMALTTGIPTSEIQSMVDANKAKNNQVQLVQSQDDSGNLVLLGVDKNGKVVSTTTVPGTNTGKLTAKNGGDVGGSTGSTGTKDSNGLTKEDYQNYLLNDIKNKITLKSLAQKYLGQGGLTIDKIYQLYAQNSPWGAPKETLAQVKAGTYAD